MPKPVKGLSSVLGRHEPKQSTVHRRQELGANASLVDLWVTSVLGGPQGPKALPLPAVLIINRASLASSLIPDTAWIGTDPALLFCSLLSLLSKTPTPSPCQHRLPMLGALFF